MKVDLPLAKIGRQLERSLGENWQSEGEEGYQRAESAEVVYAYQRVSALAYPSNRGECASCSQNT